MSVLKVKTNCDNSFDNSIRKDILEYLFSMTICKDLSITLIKLVPKILKMFYILYIKCLG